MVEGHMVYSKMPSIASTDNGMDSIRVIPNQTVGMIVKSIPCLDNHEWYLVAWSSNLYKKWHRDIELEEVR